jgi:hypothetical protein
MRRKPLASIPGKPGSSTLSSSDYAGGPAARRRLFGEQGSSSSVDVAVRLEAAISSPDHPMSAASDLSSALSSRRSSAANAGEIALRPPHFSKSCDDVFMTECWAKFGQLERQEYFPAMNRKYSCRCGLRRNRRHRKMRVASPSMPYCAKRSLVLSRRCIAIISFAQNMKVWRPAAKDGMQKRRMT